jgi:hypothetical protein
MLMLFGDPALEIALPGRPDLLTGSIAFDPISPVAGARDTIIADVYNAGRVAASDLTVRFTSGHPESSGVRPIADLILPELGPGEHTAVRAVWDSLPDPGTYPIYVWVDPDDRIAESSEWNNLAGDTLRVRFPNQVEDSMPPHIVILLDGQTVGEEFHDRDFAPPRPIVEAVLSDGETGIDTHTVKFLLNSTNVTGFTLDKHDAAPDTVRFTCRMDSLPDGTYNLTLRVSDCGCEPNETAAHVTFAVASDLEMRNPAAYPNPSPGSTTFAFSLSRPADRVIIRIYTPTGRLVGSLEGGPCGRNLNTVNWDCRDREGRDVASGVYFYSIQAGRRSEKTSSRGKVIVLR